MKQKSMLILCTPGKMELDPLTQLRAVHRDADAKRKALIALVGPLLKLELKKKRGFCHDYERYDVCKLFGLEGQQEFWEGTNAKIVSHLQSEEKRLLAEIDQDEACIAKWIAASPQLSREEPPHETIERQHAARLTYLACEIARHMEYIKDANVDASLTPKGFYWDADAEPYLKKIEVYVATRNKYREEHAALMQAITEARAKAQTVT